MADSPILPGVQAWKDASGRPLPPEFFRFLRDLVAFVKRTEGNSEQIAQIIEQLADLLSRTYSLTGEDSVQVIGLLKDGATVSLVNDEASPLPAHFYATGDDRAKGWNPLYPHWVPNPYADYIVDENGNYIVDEDGNFIASNDPTFDLSGSAAAALSAANTYTEDGLSLKQNYYPTIFFIDEVNGRIGVGTMTPLFQFHVEGSTAGLYLNRTGGAESFIALAMGGTTQGQLRADVAGYLKVTNALGSTELIRLGADLGVIGGRLFGTALHNNAGGITGTTNQYVGSGTYTPTLTNSANIDASTPQVFQYTRTGNVVTVSGSVNIDPTAATTLTTLGISLPIASDLTSYVQCCGTAVSRLAGAYGDIQGDTTNDRATLNFTNGASTGNNAWFLTFTYLVR